MPTFKEQGVDLVASEWYVMVAPAKTPRPIVDKINAELRRIFAIPNLSDRIASIQLPGSTPDEARDFVKAKPALGAGHQEAWAEGGVGAAGLSPRPRQQLRAHLGAAV